MTAPALPAVKVDGPERLSLLCVPYDSPELIGMQGPDGIVMFREMFRSDSWAELPARVPLNHAHDAEQPLGWVSLHSTSEGLHGDAELIDTSAARDAMAQVKAGLRLGISIGFREDSRQDVWSRPAGSRQLPQVLRMGARLEEVSLVSRAAYASARVISVTRSSWEHQQSEHVMAPYRAQRQREEAQQRQQQRASDQALLAELDTLASVRWADPAGEALRSPESNADAQSGGITPATALQARTQTLGTDNAGIVVQLGWRRYAVRGAASLADAQQRAQTAVMLENFPRGDMPFGVHYRWYGVTPLDND